MLTWLKRRLQTWLGVTVATAAVNDPPSTPMSIANHLLVKAGEKFIVDRKIKAPELPPMVRDGFVYDAAKDPGRLGPPVLAFDDAANAPTWAYLNQQNCGMGFPGYPYLAELSQRSEYRAPTETVAAEATREWIDIIVRGKVSAKKREVAEDEEVDAQIEDKIETLEEAMEEFGLRDCFRRISEWDGFFGRAQLYINIDPGNKDQHEVDQLPLIVDPATIKKGSLRGFKVIEPIWTSPYAYNSSDPTKPDFYKPRAWFVVGRRVHASRLLTFVSREVPDMLKPAYNFGGLSMSQLMEPYVFQWLRTRNSVSDLVHNFSVMCLKTDMSAVLQGDACAGMGLLDRARLFSQTRDNQGLMLLDNNREDMVSVNVPLSTLDKLQAQAQEHMAAPSHIPLVKLTGITPAGLNADSEGEIQVWYDWIRSYQIAVFSKHLKHVLDILQLHCFGSIDEAIGFDYKPLASPTVKELAEIRKANAETDQTYVNMSAISPEEVRERVSADPESGYNNLTGPAPQSAQQLDAEHGMELDKAKAEHSAELQDKAAQAAHERDQQQAA